MSENKLPAWAIDGLAAAGLSAEDWEPKEMFGLGVKTTFQVGKRSHWFEIYPPGDGFGNQHSFWFDGLIIESVQDAPDAFKLAARLAAALENKPDPRTVELEFQIYKLEKALRNCRAVASRRFERVRHPENTEAFFGYIVGFVNDAIGEPSLIRGENNTLSEANGE